MGMNTMTMRGAMATVLLTAAGLGMAVPEAAQEKDTDFGPVWTADDELVLPTGYHDWVFLGSPLTPHALNGHNAPFPEYHNVYVHPRNLAAYRKTGEWPEGTILLKELQLTRPGQHPDGSGLEVSGRGFFPGERNGIDISVKDSTRFAATDDWGFFNFGHHAPPYASSAKAQPAENCAGCHQANADEMVFRKFYEPILNAGL